MKKTILCIILLATIFTSCVKTTNNTMYNKDTIKESKMSSNNLTNKKPNFDETTLDNNESSEIFINTQNELLNNECKLIVNGKEVEHKGYAKINIEKKYAELPLITVLEAFGAKINWKTSCNAQIFLKDKIYLLDTQNNILSLSEESSNNLMFPAPGTNHTSVFKLVENDYIVDSSSLILFMRSIEAKITIDYEKLSINVIEL